MSEQRDFSLPEEMEGAVQAIFTHHKPDPAFVDRLGHQLSTQANQNAIPRHKIQTFIMPLAWGTIGLILLLALVWGIKTLIPKVEPSGVIQSTPSPVVVPTTSSVITPLVFPSGLQWWPEEAITSGNVNIITEISLNKWGNINGNSVNCVVFSPDGQILATVVREAAVNLFNVLTGELLAKLETKFDVVTSVTFSPDGKLLAIAGWRYEPLEHRVQIWDVATREQRSQLDGFNDAVFSLDFSPDGATLLTGEGNGYGVPGSAKIWDVATSELLDLFGINIQVDPQYYSTVYDADFSPDGSLVAAASGGEGVLIWDVVKQERATVLTDPNNFVMIVAFSPDGNLLASAGQTGEDLVNKKGNIRLWDIATGQTLFILEGQKPIGGIAFSPDGRVLASASRDGSLWFWDVETGKALGMLDALWTDLDMNSDPIAFSPDGRLLVTGGGRVRAWGIPLANAAQPDMISPSIGGGVPTPEPPIQPTPQPVPEDLGVEKIILPVLATGENFELGTWSQDGSYLYYYDKRVFDEPGPDQVIISLHFLNALTGEICDSLQETIKLVDTVYGKKPEGAGLSERTAWLDDNRLLYISPAGELLAITPCSATAENWSAALPEPARSFARVVDGEYALVLIKGEQAYWLFTPATQESVKLGLPIPLEGEEIYFAWSKWDSELVSSRLERHQDELWVILEQIDMMTGMASQIYETQASPSLERIIPMGAFVEWVGKDILLLSEPISSDWLIDLSTQPVKVTQYPDLFGIEFPGGGLTISGCEPGATGGDDYHLYFGKGDSPDGQFYLYHAESGLVDKLPFDQSILLVFPNHNTVIGEHWADNQASTDFYRVTYVDSAKETHTLEAKGHPLDSDRWISLRVLPDAQRVLFSSIQGISLVELESGKILNYWVIEAQEKYQDFYSSLSPDGKTVVGIAQQSDPNLPNWTQALYWLRLEP